MADPATLGARMAAAHAMSPKAVTAPASGSSSTEGATGSNGSSASSTEASTSSTESSADTSSTDASESPESTDAETSTETDSSGTYGSDKERIDAAVLAIEKGDLALAVKALGRDVKLKGADAKAFKAISVREQKHAARVKAETAKLTEQTAAIELAKAEVVQESQRASGILRQADQRYGWAAQGERAWEEGRVVDFAKAVERMAKGASLATITQKIASAQMGKQEPVNGEERALADQRAQLKRDQDAWEKQKADEKAAAEKAKGQQSSAEKRVTALGNFGSAWKAHPFLTNPDDPSAPDPDALEQAFAAYEKTWDGKRFTKKAKEVLDELQAKEVRKLKRLGITPTAVANAAPATTAGTTPGKAGKPPPKPRLAEPPPTNGTAKPLTMDQTREARMAQARRMTEMQKRGVRA